MTEDTGVTDENDRQDRRRMPFWRAVLSVIQAAFGVQSEENRNRDFTQGSIASFIAAAIIFTVIFVLVLMLVVRLVLSG